MAVVSSMGNLAAQGLIAKGKRLGFVTYEEINALFPDADEHLDRMDALCLRLIDLGVETVSAASVQEMLSAVEPEPTPVHAPPPQRPKSVDDLYDLYMFEIRQIGLLTAEDEVKLAKLVQQGERARVHSEDKTISASHRARLCEEMRR